MFKIAICDDNRTDLSNTVSLVNDYRLLHKDRQNLEVSTFHNALDLIAAIEGKQQFDLLLLDIVMPNLTGIEAAKEIRQYNQDVKIIFTTTSTEFAVESYTVDAYYYALKPIWREKLFILLDKIFLEMNINQGTSFLIKSKAGIERIHIKRLEFAEVIGRTILYHMSDGSVVEALGSMNELEKDLLENACFIKPHRSYIVNMEYINTLSQREIKMQSFAVVPVAKANYQAIKSAYIALAFKEQNT